MRFIEDNLSKYPENVAVLFIMASDRRTLSSSTTLFAPIDYESAISLEQLVLFPMHTVFRSEDIRQTALNRRPNTIFN